MICLSHKLLPEHIVLDNKHYLNLVISNQKLLYQLLRDLNNLVNFGIISEDEFHLFNYEKDITKELKGSLIIDFLNYDINTRKIKTALVKSAVDHIEHSDLDKQIDRIHEQIIDVFNGLCLKFDLNVEYNLDIEIKDLFKVYNFQIKSHFDSLIEAIIEWIRAEIELLGHKYFFYFGLENYLTKDELDELIKFAQYNNVLVINISSRESDFSINQSSYIIDDDYCVIIK